MRTIIIYLFVLNCYFCQSQWFAQSFPPVSPRLTITCANTTTGYVAGANGALVRTTDGGTTWLVQNSGTFEHLYASTQDAYMPRNVCFIVGGNGVIRKTTNYGQTWSAVTTPTTEDYLTVYFINDMTGYVAGGNNTIIKTTNGGNTWTFLSSPLSPSIYFYSSYFQNSQTGWIGAEKNKLIYTTNGGSNWTIQNTGTSDTQSVWISISSYSAGTVWIVGGMTASPIRNTTNSGANWFAVPYPAGINTIGEIVSGFSNYIWITSSGGGMGGVYFTSNNGTSWTRQIFNDINCICFEPLFQTGWAAGLPNSIIYRTTDGGVTGFNQITNNLPEKYLLSQNYPNPFNPTTKIMFTLPKSSFVKIVVYDALGRELETLVNERLNAATYEADWDADKFSSGVYYYKLIADDYSETKKMILIK